jgi:hypothetical protein
MCILVRRLVISVIFLAYILSINVARAQSGPYTSIKQARHYKQLLKVVRVQPDQFEWEGHKVKVREAWLDRDGYLTFKLMIDGSDVKENQLADQTNSHLFFKEYPKWTVLSEHLRISAGIGGMGTLTYLPITRYPAAIFGSYGVFVHYFFLPLWDPLPKSVKLQLGTVEPGPECKETLTDTILTFYLDESDVRNSAKKGVTRN